MARRRRGGNTLDEILHDLVIRNPEHTVADLAEDLGVREYVLYEMVEPNHERKFPLALLLPLMRATGDCGVLEHLAARAGLVLFKVRKKGKSRLENAEDLLEYQEKFANTLRGLIEAFKNHGKIDKREVVKSLDQFMATLAGLREDIENLEDQLYLGLEE